MNKSPGKFSSLLLFICKEPGMKSCYWPWGKELDLLDWFARKAADHVLVSA